MITARRLAWQHLTASVDGHGPGPLVDLLRRVPDNRQHEVAQAWWQVILDVHALHDETIRTHQTILTGLSGHPWARSDYLNRAKWYEDLLPFLLLVLAHEDPTPAILASLEPRDTP